MNRQSPKKGNYPRQLYMGYYHGNYEQTPQMNKMHLQGQASMFGQGRSTRATGTGQGMQADR